MNETINWERIYELKVSYNTSLKNELFHSEFNRLEKENKLGNTIMDFGCGSDPISKELFFTHKVITIDIAKKNNDDDDRPHFKFDIDKVDKTKFETQKILLKIAKSLDINPRDEQNKEPIDTMIFSEILNYVDYKKVLKFSTDYLKPNGIIIVFNKPRRGFNNLFSEKGLTNNFEFYDFLKSENLKIEKKLFPDVDEANFLEEKDRLIFLIAQKIKK
ncbi:MAG: methyltransferase domain-containing protein [Patescibacteria group bacterium]